MTSFSHLRSELVMEKFHHAPQLQISILQLFSFFCYFSTGIKCGNLKNVQSLPFKLSVSYVIV